MQIVSNGDNLHEMSNPVFWGKNKKEYFKLSSAQIFIRVLSVKLIFTCWHIYNIIICFQEEVKVYDDIEPKDDR